MVICPIALAVHCTGCPFFKFCPAKSLLGDYVKEGDGKHTEPDSKDDGQTPKEQTGDSPKRPR